MFLKWFKKEIKPFTEGWLDVGDGHQIHYMECGNPKGKPIIRFHGGPGSSAKPKQASVFDLAKYRVVLFSQRGCGKSKFTDLMKNNNPMTTVEDTVKLLNHLEIPLKDLTLAGVSYGTTLALLFAEKHPEMVKMLLLTAVFLGRKEDLVWTDEISQIFYPDLMDEMKSKLNPNEELLDGYHRMIMSDSYEQIKTALQYYGSYEMNLGSLTPQFKPLKAVYDDRVAGSRIFIDHEKNNMYLEDNVILNNIDKIKHIPTMIVHNRLDMTCPVQQAYKLHKAMPHSKLLIVPDIGHGSEKLQKEMIYHFNKFIKERE